MNNQKVFLMILDGWGIGKKDNTDGIYNANTPFIDSLYNSVPNTTLNTFGNDVGLPDGQMGNSEVGHMNIGSGRVVWQQLALINKTFEDQKAESIDELSDLASYCNNNNKPLHLLGLVSDGGVHSSIEHLVALCELMTKKGVQNILIHGFSDGRDTDPKSGIHFFSELENRIKNTNATIVSVIGRYYAMDRDKRMERTQKAYQLLVNGIGEKFENLNSLFENQYSKGITDEFIEPFIKVNHQSVIKNEDAVLCFNFRTDRCRQITDVLTQNAFPDYNMQPLKLKFATMTEYDKSFKNIEIIFKSQNIQNTLGEVLSQHGLKQLRSAETEKYPHVTFFFSGGREECFEGEDRIMEPSPKVATYDLQPEMSALPLTHKILDALDSEQYDFICLNFANTDMVGHTGVWDAIIKAAETVDSCAEKIVNKGKKLGYQFVIIADHGNSDEARNEDGTPNTAHSLNPVPCFIISEQCKSLNQKGKLADVAPTILKLMGIEQPKEMDGNVLF